jgi:hypothetical protein
MTNIDVMRYMMHHQQQIRKGIASPTEATQAIWRVEDAKQHYLLKHYEHEEATAKAKAEATAEEDYTFNITSEVKLK